MSMEITTITKITQVEGGGFAPRIWVFLPALKNGVLVPELVSSFPLLGEELTPCWGAQWASFKDDRWIPPDVLEIAPEGQFRFRWQELPTCPTAEEAADLAKGAATQIADTLRARKRVEIPAFREDFRI